MRPKSLDWKNCELFTDRCSFTDDTVMSIATKYAIQNNIKFADAYRMFGRRYPNAGYGGMFRKWLDDDEMNAYNSFGNGSAMRVSYVADAFGEYRAVLDVAEASAVCTHNHEEGIKGAKTAALLIGAAKHGWNKDQMLNEANKAYPRNKYRWSPELTLDEIRPVYKWDVTCQGSVPVAFRCFYESDSYESCIRNVMSLPCDMDTLGAIAGPIAEEYYGGTGLDNKAILERYLDKWLLERLYE